MTNEYKTDKNKYKPLLCYRCEHRIRFMEETYWDFKSPIRPRMECGNVGQGVHSCYMFEPIKPLIIQTNQGDQRPINAGWLINARSHVVELADFIKDMIVLKDKKFIIYWKPKEGEKND